MRVLLVGGTGFLGRLLQRALAARGDEPWVLTRQPVRGPGQLRWDPSRGFADPASVPDFDAVVNLAGAPIADRPWTRARRKVLWESRVDVTASLVAALASRPSPPRVYLGASSLGYFGDRGDDWLDEEAPVGTGFLAELSQAWEEQHAASERALGCRPVWLRMTVVLSNEGGAFPLLVRPFQLALGGWLGDGRQFTSWIGDADAVAAWLWALDRETARGPLHATVPSPIPNYDWVKALGRALHRPVLTKAPKWALRGALGELADDLYLASIRARPAALERAGFAFQEPEVDDVFRRLVGGVEAPR